MSNNDIFDEIIQCLRGIAATDPLTSVRREVVEALYSPADRSPARGGASASEPALGNPAATLRTDPVSLPGSPVSARGSGQRRVIHTTPASNLERFESNDGRRVPAVETPYPTSAGTSPYSPSQGPVSCADMSWEQLEAAARQCTACPLCKARKSVVFGDGSTSAELMFIGEGPGADEDAQGIPFVGRAGMLLTKMIIAMQFSREDVYIANIVKCRPPNNRVPEDSEAEVCLPYLRRQIALVRPKVIVLLGAIPLKHLMGLNGITKMRGNWLEYEGIRVMPTFHPSYLLRNEQAKAPVWQDLQQVMKVFGKTPPPRGTKR